MVVTLYLAGPLFTLAEKNFNEELASRLENNFSVILPQRDGFVYPELLFKLQGTFDDIETISKNLIYYLDLGHFIPKSDVIIANLDEPIDPGTVVEMIYGKKFGKSIISYRTDMRMPFGSLSDKFAGMHTFPAYQSDVLIKLSTNNTKSQIDELSNKISYVINKTGYFSNKKSLSQIVVGAKILFDGLSDFKRENLDKIISRYAANQKYLENIMPKIY